MTALGRKPIARTVVENDEPFRDTAIFSTVDCVQLTRA